MPLEPETIIRIKTYAATAIIVIISLLFVAILAAHFPIIFSEFFIIGWALLMMGVTGRIFQFFENKFENDDLIKMYQAREQWEREQENQSDMEESLPSSDDEEDNSPMTNKTQSLRDLKALLDDGTITNEEFKKLKKEILE